jgi:hypothetical protein
MLGVLAGLADYGAGRAQKLVAHHDLFSRERRKNAAFLSGTFRGLYPRLPPHLPNFVQFSLPWQRRHKMQKTPYLRGFLWSEREDLNLRPLVSQTSALTGLRHAPMLFP